MKTINEIIGSIEKNYNINLGKLNQEEITETIEIYKRNYVPLEQWVENIITESCFTRGYEKPSDDEIQVIVQYLKHRDFIDATRDIIEFWLLKADWKYRKVQKITISDFFVQPNSIPDFKEPTITLTEHQRRFKQFKDLLVRDSLRQDISRAVFRELSLVHVTENMDALESHVKTLRAYLEAKDTINHQSNALKMLAKNYEALKEIFHHYKEPAEAKISELNAKIENLELELADFRGEITTNFEVFSVEKE